MKKLAFLIAALVFALPHTASADEAEGTIVAVDEDTQSLKLDDGTTYKLPSEFDYSILSKDMKVIVVLMSKGMKKS